MDYIEKKENDLQGVLAVYENDLIYYPCNSIGELSNGELLRIDTAKKIFDSLSEIDLLCSDYDFEDLIPYNVLKYSKTEKKIIWFTEPKTETLLFQKKLEIVSGIYPLPHLLWKLTENGLSVWALKEKPMSRKSILYHAPFLNVNSAGEICMGNAKFQVDSKEYSLIMQTAEKAFFNSFFTHTNHNFIINTNLIDFYKGSINKAHFNCDVLLKTNLKIENIL